MIGILLYVLSVFLLQVIAKNYVISTFIYHNDILLITFIIEVSSHIENSHVSNLAYFCTHVQTIIKLMLEILCWYVYMVVAVNERISDIEP